MEANISSGEVFCWVIDLAQASIGPISLPSLSRWLETRPASQPLAGRFAQGEAARPVVRKKWNPWFPLLGLASLAFFWVDSNATVELCCHLLLSFSGTGWDVLFSAQGVPLPRWVSLICENSKANLEGNSYLIEMRPAPFFEVQKKTLNITSQKMGFRERHKDALEFCLSVGYERVLGPSDPFRKCLGVLGLPMALPVLILPRCII